MDPAQTPESPDKLTARLFREYIPLHHRKGIPAFGFPTLYHLDVDLQPSLKRSIGLLSVRVPSVLAYGALTSSAYLYHGGCFYDPTHVPERPTNTILRRSHYLTGLNERIIQAQSVNHLPMLNALRWERDRWLELDNQHLRRIWFLINPWMPLPEDRIRNKDEHWVWRDVDQTDAGNPTCTWMGSHQTPVYRLLWTVVREHEALVNDVGRPAHPRRNTKLCTDRMCVNPRHFEYATPVRRSDTILRGHGGSHGPFNNRLPAENHAWSIASSVWRPDPDGFFERLVVCPHGHLFGRATQVHYNRALRKLERGYGTGYCPGCHEVLVTQGVARPKQPRKGQPVDYDLNKSYGDAFRDTPFRPPTEPDLFADPHSQDNPA